MEGETASHRRIFVASYATASAQEEAIEAADKGVNIDGDTETAGDHHGGCQQRNEALRCTGYRLSNLLSDY